MKIQKCILFSLFLCSVIFYGSTALAESSEKAAIVNFPVRLNKTLVNNINSDYPMLLYKNITYVPLTYDVCNYMGFQANWDQTAGLTISKTGQFPDYKVNESKGSINQLDTGYQVIIPDLTINGTKIDNSKESWPLLNYRDITYFPLTWRFAVDLLGWEYSWSKDRGLAISYPGGNKNDKETILATLNLMNFGQGYRFKSVISEVNNNPVMELSGKVRSEVRGSNFLLRIILDDPIKKNGTTINEVYTEYRDSNIYQNNGLGVVYNSEYPGLAVGPTLMSRTESKMMEQLLKLHFVGEKKFH